MTSYLRAETVADCPFSIAIEYAVKFLRRDTAGQRAFTVRLPLAPGHVVLGELRRRVCLRFSVHYGVADGARGHNEIHFTWQAQTRWLPDLAGVLSMSIATEAATHVVLAGSYRPPFGTFGSLFDGLIGRRIAAATAQDFIERVKGFLETEERAFRAAHRAAP